MEGGWGIRCMTSRATLLSWHRPFLDMKVSSNPPPPHYISHPRTRPFATSRGHLLGMSMFAVCANEVLGGAVLLCKPEVWGGVRADADVSAASRRPGERILFVHRPACLPACLSVCCQTRHREPVNHNVAAPLRFQGLRWQGDKARDLHEEALLFIATHDSPCLFIHVFLYRWRNN